MLYAGSLVEEGPAADLLARPLHPYTMRLLRCLPAAGRRKSDGKLDAIPGFMPPPGSVLPGCVFAPRCDFADRLCRTVAPERWAFGPQVARCHHIEQAMASPPPKPPPVEAPDVRAASGHKALRAVAVSKTFRVGRHSVRAVTDVSLDLAPGETLGLVGESGSGKTTLARLLLGLTEPDAGGRIELGGQVVEGHARSRSRSDQKALQIVFQNPDSALNRSHTVRHLIGRSLSRLAGLFGRQKTERMAGLVSAVRLTERHLSMRPRQLSGGLKQRVAIARAFAGDPRVVICDEPTSALDVSVQAAILNLLAELQVSAQVSYIFISHDLGVVRYLSDRIAVLYLGRIMEIGPAEDVFHGPHHPYTEALLSAVPEVDAPGTEGVRRGRIRLSGEIPSPLAPPPGCVFHGRCPRKIGRSARRPSRRCTWRRVMRSGVICRSKTSGGVAGHCRRARTVATPFRHRFSKMTTLGEAEGMSVPPRPSTPLMGNIAAHLAALLPKARHARIIRSWAGVIENTPDGRPVIDRLADPANVVVATLSSIGFGLSPASGHAVQELVTEGACSFADLRPLRLSRFAELDSDWAAQRGWQWRGAA